MINQLAGVDEFYKLILGESKEVQKYFQPRRILPPVGFTNPKYFSAILASQALRKEMDQELDPIFGNTWVVASQLMEKQIPTYFIGEEYLRAVAATKLPDDFTVGEINWPLDAMLFVWPTNFIQEYTGTDFFVPFTSLSFAKKGIHNMRGLRIGLEDDKACFWHNVFYKNEIIPLDYSAAFRPWLKIEKAVNEEVFVDWAKDFDKRFGFKEIQIPEEIDKRFSNMMTALVFKVLLTITARPHLLKNGELIRKEKIKKGKIRDALWSPNTIGFHYKIIHEAVDFNSTGIKLRGHWRAGHFTNQPIGPREAVIHVDSLPRDAKGNIDWERVSEETRKAFWKSHKRMWIDAVFVGEL